MELRDGRAARADQPAAEDDERDAAGDRGALLGGDVLPLAEEDEEAEHRDRRDGAVLHRELARHLEVIPPASISAVSQSEGKETVSRKIYFDYFLFFLCFVFSNYVTFRFMSRLDITLH